MSLYPKKTDQVLAKAVSELSGADLKVFLSIWINQQGFGTSASFLARRSNLSLNTVKRSLKDLKDANWISYSGKRKVQGKNVNCYDLHYDKKLLMRIDSEPEKKIDAVVYEKPTEVKDEFFEELDREMDKFLRIK